MPDDALQVIRYTIQPEIAADDRNKAWMRMDKLRLHYTGSIGSSVLADLSLGTLNQLTNSMLLSIHHTVGQYLNIVLGGMRTMKIK